MGWLALTWILAATAADGAAESAVVEPAATPVRRAIASDALPRSSEYRIRYYGVDVISASVEVTTPRPDRLVVTASARTTLVGGLLYAIDNTYEVEVDSGTLATTTWTKRIRQKDLEQDLRAEADAGRDVLCYEGAGELPTPEAATHFVAVLGAAGLRRWSPGERETHRLDMEGRHLALELACTGREEREVLGAERRCVVLEVTLEELESSPGDLLERTDILTHRLADDRFRWRIWITDDDASMLAGVRIGRPDGLHAEAELVRHRGPDGEERRGPRGRGSRRGRKGD